MECRNRKLSEHAKGLYGRHSSESQTMCAVHARLRRFAASLPVSERGACREPGAILAQNVFSFVILRGRGITDEECHWRVLFRLTPCSPGARDGIWRSSTSPLRALRHNALLDL